MQAIDVGYGFGTSGMVDVADSGLVPYGWDLDGKCTCHGSPAGPPSCSQAAGTKENCDDDAGRDHIALEIFRVLGVTAETGSQTANQAMQDGQYGLLVQITGYNGTPNDEQVTVAIYASNGLAAPDGGKPAPMHNGNDQWTVDPKYIGPAAPVGTNCDNNNALCVPSYSDGDAYVTNGVLVANLGEVPLTFGNQPNIGGAVMLLNDLLLVGTLVQTGISGGDVGWSIVNGSVSGRWETSDLLANLATIPDPMFPGSYFCGGDPVYPASSRKASARSRTSRPSRATTTKPRSPHAMRSRWRSASRRNPHASERSWASPPLWRVARTTQAFSGKTAVIDLRAFRALRWSGLAPGKRTLSTTASMMSSGRPMMSSGCPMMSP